MFRRSIILNSVFVLLSIVLFRFPEVASPTIFIFVVAASISVIYIIYSGNLKWKRPIIKWAEVSIVFLTLQSLSTLPKAIQVDLLNPNKIYSIFVAPLLEESFRFCLYIFHTSPIVSALVLTSIHDSISINRFIALELLFLYLSGYAIRYGLISAIILHTMYNCFFIAIPIQFTISLLLIVFIIPSSRHKMIEEIKSYSLNIIETPEKRG